MSDWHRKIEGDEIADRLIFAERELARCGLARVAEKKFMRHFGVGRTIARRYTRAVKRLWELDGRRNGGPERFRENRARIMSIYDDARESGDLGLAMRAAERISILDGFGPTFDARVLVENVTKERPLIISNDDALMIVDEMRKTAALEAGDGENED